MRSYISVLWDNNLYLSSVQCTWKLDDSWLYHELSIWLVKLSEFAVLIMFSEAGVRGNDECIRRPLDIKRISTLIKNAGFDLGALVSEASHRLLRDYMNVHCCVPIIDAR